MIELSVSIAKDAMLQTLSKKLFESYQNSKVKAYYQELSGSRLFTSGSVSKERIARLALIVARKSYII